MNQREYTTEVFDPKDFCPRKARRVLALVFEWTGPYIEKPDEPEWVIKHYSDHWPKERYQYDTGGYEWLEVVSWCELPPVKPTWGRK